jgi:hypothetical protein|tara:strand:+ start:540 stop:719 length:180 start_codon:yes stop_codon:yes gene_type:complete
MNTPTFYDTVKGLANRFPNNMELGNSIRSLLWKIEDAEKSKESEDPSQLQMDFPDVNNA